MLLSGLAMQGKSSGSVIQNIVNWHDEQVVTALLASGDLEKAKELIFKLAPPYDPQAVDAKSRKLKIPTYSIAHLRSRARVYAAMANWDAALKDAEEVVDKQIGTDGGMSLRTIELDESEALRDMILQKQKEAKK